MSKQITKDDLERQLRSLQGDVTERINDKKRELLAVGGVVVGVVLLVAFLLGRRSGKKRTTIVEIRRV